MTTVIGSGFRASCTNTLPERNKLRTRIKVFKNCTKILNPHLQNILGPEMEYATYPHNARLVKFKNNAWNSVKMKSNFYVLTLWQGSVFARKTFKHVSLINFVGVIKQLFKKALSTNIKALFLSAHISIYYIYCIYISINYIYKCSIYELFDTNCVINIALNYLKCNALRRYISCCLNFVL